jgi:polar amino acid transport system substrate-binding protein
MHLFIGPTFPGLLSRQLRLRTRQKPILKVGAFAGFAPFAWRENGEPQGRDLAFLRRFAANEGWDFQVEFFEFNRLWERPSLGQIDIAASGISRLARGRDATVAWSRPYAEVRRTMLIRQDDSERFHQMKDLHGARLAAVPGSAADDHAIRTKPASAKLTYCETLEQGVDELLAGRVDAVGTGDISARHHVAHRDGLAAIDVHGAAPREYVAFSVRRHHPLLRRLNAFIAHAGAGY